MGKSLQPEYAGLKIVRQNPRRGRIPCPAAPIIEPLPADRPVHGAEPAAKRRIRKSQQDGDAGRTRAGPAAFMTLSAHPAAGFPADEHGNQVAGAQRLPGEEIGLQRDPRCRPTGHLRAPSELVALSGPLTVTASSDKTLPRS